MSHVRDVLYIALVLGWPVWLFLGISGVLAWKMRDQ